MDLDIKHQREVLEYYGVLFIDFKDFIYLQAKKMRDKINVLKRYQSNFNS